MIIHAALRNEKIVRKSRFWRDSNPRPSYPVSCALSLHHCPLFGRLARKPQCENLYLISECIYVQKSKLRSDVNILEEKTACLQSRKCYVIKTQANYCNALKPVLILCIVLVRIQYYDDHHRIQTSERIIRVLMI